MIITSYLILTLFVIVLIRAWFLMGKISRFIDDTDYRDAKRYSKEFLERM